MNLTKINNVIGIVTRPYPYPIAIHTKNINVKNIIVYIDTRPSNKIIKNNTANPTTAAQKFPKV